jgi:hypothetical protein
MIDFYALRLFITQRWYRRRYVESVLRRWGVSQRKSVMLASRWVR